MYWYCFKGSFHSSCDSSKNFLRYSLRSSSPDCWRNSFLIFFRNVSLNSIRNSLFIPFRTLSGISSGFLLVFRSPRNSSRNSFQASSRNSLQASSQSSFQDSSTNCLLYSFRNFLRVPRKSFRSLLWNYYRNFLRHSWRSCRRNLFKNPLEETPGRIPDGASEGLLDQFWYHNQNSWKGFTDFSDRFQWSFRSILFKNSF